MLGRAEAKERDAAREAVAGAPADAEKGLASLNEGERQVWRAAVTAYAGGLSKKDTVFDATLPALTTALARAGDAPVAPAAPELTRESGPEPTRGSARERRIRRDSMPRHAPHSKASRPSIGGYGGRRIAPRIRRGAPATQSLVDRHGRAILDFLTKAYGQPWPADGYAVHLSMYANWAGAYSTDGHLLVVATNPAAGTSGLDGLETVFHEGMHQWDDGMIATIKELASANNLPAPPRLVARAHLLHRRRCGEARRARARALRRSQRPVARVRAVQAAD